METMEFGSNSSQILKYIPTVEDVPENEPPVDRMDSVSTRRGTEDLRVPHPEKNSEQIEMDFSTPISEVMPAAAFDSGVDAATYNSPTTQRVTGVSPGMIGGPPTKTDTKNPLGLTDEQFQAAIAGLAAIVAFSKPVQEKLADMVPKFLTDSGNVSTTGMAITALLTAVVFYFALKLLKNQK